MVPAKTGPRAEYKSINQRDNTAVSLDPLPVSRARLAVVEPALVLSETCLKRQRQSKVPQNARYTPSYGFSTQKVNVQRKFTSKLLLFMVTL
jgi:hypothetical protein